MFADTLKHTAQKKKLKPWWRVADDRLACLTICVRFYDTRTLSIEMRHQRYLWMHVMLFSSAKKRERVLNNLLLHTDSSEAHQPNIQATHFYSNNSILNECEVSFFASPFYSGCKRILIQNSMGFVEIALKLITSLRSMCNSHSTVSLFFYFYIKLWAFRSEMGEFLSMWDL